MSIIEKTLEQARATLTIATNDAELIAILSRYGYGVEQLQEGKALYEAARDSVRMQSDHHFHKVNTTQAFQELWRLAKLHYQNDLRVARMALKEHQPLRHFLQLEGTRPQSFQSWLGQAKEFYTRLSDRPELLALVAPMGLTSERIEKGLEYMHRLENFRTQRQSENGHSVNTRMQRNESFEALNRWMFTFRMVARGVLALYPAHLMTLGLGTESRKQKKSTGVLLVTRPSAENAEMSNMVQ